MLAEYSSRMSLKNSIVIGALTGEEPYDPARYLEAARAALEALATESALAAERLATQRRLAGYMDGKARHVHDYHPADRGNLKRREELSLEMARRLLENRDDETYLLQLIERARADAWHEISAAVEQSLDRLDIPVDATYRRERAERMRQLVTIDLAQLLESA